MEGMTYAAKIVADSIAGTRLTSIEVTFPRFILAEFNTHRVFSRNSASSRAIPVEKRIAQVRSNPFVPEAFSKNRKGMQAEENIASQTAEAARETWLAQSRAACDAAERLALLDVHKQHANRILEPFVWHTVIVTATEWENFFALRTDKAAQPEMQITAKLMRDAMEASTPRKLVHGDWHLPYYDEKVDFEAVYDWYSKGGEAEPTDVIRAMSVVRCAAVSYERQQASRPISEYLSRHDDLLAAGHMSPFEHQALVNEKAFGVCDLYSGNFRKPWMQYRKMLRGEAVWRPR